MSLSGPQPLLRRGFEGSERFVVERQLGQGGMGSVHLVFDRDRGERVALKCLDRLDPDAVFRFKQEFRSLCDLRHPNLVKLHELFHERGQWFFTMEHVDGDNLLEHLHGDDDYVDLNAVDTGEASITFDLDETPPTPVQDMDQLRRVMLQIAEALCALHGAGLLHRDLKPENVLVDRQGRVVLLDFGIAVDRSALLAGDTLGGPLFGTPAYMAPEQVDEGAGPAADWYAFGVMLYQVLCNELPFEGAEPSELLARKRTQVPASVTSRAEGIPPELAQLCMGLLLRDPAARPDGSAVRRLLRRALRLAPATQERLRRSSAIMSPFVGRQAELRQLEQALAVVQAGRPALAWVHGPAGIGKTRLVRQLLLSLADGESSVVLAGRCYEQESVAFQGVDSLVDSLARFLRKLPERAVAGLLPRYLGALLSVFPVLGRVPMLSDTNRQRRFDVPGDPVLVRRQAFLALKELLDRLTDEYRVLLFIDDLQWGDLDTAALLGELLSAPGTPPLLLICAFRSEPELPLRAVDALRAQGLTRGALLEVDVELSELAADEAAELARSLLGDSGIDADRLTLDAEGNPHLLTELAHFAQREAPQFMAEGRLPSLAQLMAHRLAGLSSGARHLLSVLSVAKGPLPRSVCNAFGDVEELSGEIRELQDARLVRAVVSRGTPTLQVYHERLRAVVLEQLEATEVASLHGRLARAFSAQARPEPERIARHWLLAGDRARGVSFALEAAERAVGEFAFDRAAGLYQTVVDSGAVAEGALKALRLRLAEVLSLGGRRAEAAKVLLGAAEAAPNSEHADLRRRAALELVLSGEPGVGLELLNEALAAHGYRLPDDPEAALPTTLALREQLGRRGFRCVAVAPEEIARESEQRLDLLWAAGFGLNLQRGMVSYPMVAHYLIEVLEVGDRFRQVRGLCLYQMLIATPLAQVLQLPPQPALEAARGLAEEGHDPRCQAWVLLATGFEHYLRGESQQCIEALQAAHATLTTRCSGMGPEVGLCSALLVNALFWAPRWDEIGRRAEQPHAEAVARNDLLSGLVLELEVALVALLSGELERAERVFERLRSRGASLGPEQQFGFRSIEAVTGLISGTDGHLRRYLDGVEAFLRTPRGSVPVFRSEVLMMSARARLGLASRALEPDALLEQAERELGQVQQMNLPCFRGHALLARAAVATQRGRGRLALAFVDAALQQARELGPCWEPILRYARAHLDPSPAASDALCAAELELRRLGFEDVSSRVRCLAPGLF